MKPLPRHVYDTPAEMAVELLNRIVDMSLRIPDALPPAAILHVRRALLELGHPRPTPSPTRSTTQDPLH